MPRRVEAERKRKRQAKECVKIDSLFKKKKEETEENTASGSELSELPENENEQEESVNPGTVKIIIFSFSH
jgi:hypothetical protein